MIHRLESGVRGHVLFAALLVRQMALEGLPLRPRLRSVRILLHPMGSLPSQGATHKAVNGDVGDVGKLQGSEGGSVMNVVMFPIVVLGGVLAGWLAGFVMERGGYGLKWDIVLGLAGSAVGSWIFWALGASPGAGLAVLAVVAFLGAAIPIVAQRQIWPRTP